MGAPVIPYVQQSWTDGSSQCNAARNSVHEDGIRDAHFMPAVRVYHNAAQSIADNTATSLAFNSERFDQCANAADTMHDTVTNNSRLTCRYAGVYQISGTIEWAANVTGVRQLSIRVNGGSAIAATYDLAWGANIAQQSISTLYALAVNDYVELRVIQTSGVALNVNSSGNYSPEFMMVRVG